MLLYSSTIRVTIVKVIEKYANELQFAFLLVILAIGGITALLSPMIGLYLHVIVLLILLGVASVHTKLKHILCATSIFPAIHIMQSAMPAFSLFIQYLILLIPVLLFTLTQKKVFNIQSSLMSLHDLRYVPIVITPGILMGWMMSLVSPTAQVIDVSIYSIFALIIVSSATLELLLRGVIQYSLQNLCDRTVSVIIPSILHALLFMSLGVSSMVYIFVVSFLASLFYNEKANILLTSAFTTAAAASYFLFSL